MIKLIATAALLSGLPVFASAQNDAQHVYHGEGYLFGAAGATSPATLQLGGGGEGFVYKGVGLGGELYWTILPSGLTGERTGSIDVSYHFGSSTRNRKLDGFVTGGYTLFSRPKTGLGIASGGNFGGGVNIWLKEHAALRLEVRDIVGGRNISVCFEPSFTSYLAPQNLVAFRIGLTFR